MELPPPGRWALGAEAQVFAEKLLLQAQRQGLRTGWLGAEAGFLSNLSVQENLRLLHEWHGADAAAFEPALREAQVLVSQFRPEWLQQRPAQLRDPQLLKASLLRIFLLRPQVLVLQPEALRQAGPVLADQLVAALTESRLLLLAEPASEWPAWPQSGPVAAVEEHPA